MLALPRLAVGCIQEQADAEPLCWALMELLVRRRYQPQHFRSRACFSPPSAALSVTGGDSRHLDSWLMSRDVCREVFAHGCTHRDVGIVSGRFDQSHGGLVARPELPRSVHPPRTDRECPAMARAAAAPFGGRLESLCEWLDLPRLVVLDVSLLGECRLPTPPSRIDGLLLDNVASTSDVYRWQTWLEASWGVPVLGALEARPTLRAEASGPRVREACRELGNLLARHVLLERLIQLAGRRPLPDVEPALFRPARCYEPLTVALAYDAAFNCYFADTVDLLEARGARIVDFSPLADEALPLGTDLVYMGCGHPERFADELARNNCMLVALRNHVRAGRRIYAEGGGAAYLCQHLDHSRGGLVPMVGALPATARLVESPPPVKPVEVTVSKSNWLAERGDTLRGYLNARWTFEPNGELKRYVVEPDHQSDLVGRYQVLASRIHLNFAAHERMVGHFFQRHAAYIV